MGKKIYTIDGRNIESLESFYEEISRKLIPNVDWGHNLDAFNDILHGDFGTPEEGFVLVWENSNLTKEKLSYPETVKWLKKKLDLAHLSNRDSLLREIENAENQRGQTLFNIIVDIIQSHANIELQFN